MNITKIKIGKLNFLDIIIILVILVFIGIFMITNMNSGDEGAIATGNNNVNTKFIYTISVDGLSDTSAQMIKVGDEVYDKVSNTYIGKIVELNVTDAQGRLDKDNGEVVLARIPGKIDVDFVIETEGSIKNGEYLANGLTRILVGNFKEIKTKYLMCSGTISEIRK